MDMNFVDGVVSFPAPAIAGFVRAASARLAIPAAELAREAGADPLILDSTDEVSGEVFWPFARLAYERKLIDLLPLNGLPSFNYDLGQGIDLERSPIGIDADFSSLKLNLRPVMIGGHRTDFPLGVPASILTANASYLRYYSARGYSVLTYKTVRSRAHPGHSFPQWVSLDEAEQFKVNSKGAESTPSFFGTLSKVPRSIEHASMANSFGVPSLPPEEWMEDLRQARQFVREGHEILIVSVMASVSTDLDAIAADFAETARLAKSCGADVIELNFSCPNTPDKLGLIYQFPAAAREICEAVREAVGADTPILTKIGYLNDRWLRKYVESTASVVDGFVAINTMWAPVHQRTPKGDETIFVGREGAGVSGWAINRAAHRMAGVLVRLRNEFSHRLNKKLYVLGLGGVMTREDFESRLALGVDAVEICTGSYFNPLLGFECRHAQGRIDVSVRNGTIVRGTQMTPGAGAGSLPSAGAASRAPGGSATMLKSAHEKLPQASGIIDPVAATARAREYLARTDPHEIVKRRRERNAELAESFPDLDE